MSFFGSKSEGGMMDVIRCDETDYLVWKWTPNGQALTTNKENSIRWGSSLRVKDGEVAVFVYKQKDGPNQDFIEGPYDDIIKTANFPILSNIIGLAYAGASPFQAEVYFVNLAGNIRLGFGTPSFDVFDPRFEDKPVSVQARGSLTFNITDYKAFVKLHRLVNFEMQEFSLGVRDAVLKNVKGVIQNSPADHNMSVLKLEQKLLDINDLIDPRLRKAFTEDFGVNLKRFDLSEIEIDKGEQYQELRALTAGIQSATLLKQSEINLKNMDQLQEINADNMIETLRIQREQAERLAILQTQSQFLGAHQANLQADVLKTAADNLGQMGTMNLSGGGTGGGGGGNINPAGMMTGMAIGGAMGGQMAGMMNSFGQNVAAAGAAPPPPPQISYNVSVNGQTGGPFNLGQLQEMARTGQFTTGTHVWKSGMANWDLAGNMPDLTFIFSANVPPPPAAQGM